MKRGEGIVGDLRPRRGDRSEEGRFAGVRQPDQPCIGDQLQPEPDDALLARQAGIEAARGAVGRRLEVGVAEAAIAALGEQHTLPKRVEVGDQRLVVFLEDLGADRHLQRRVVAAGAGALAAHAAAAVLRLEMLLVAVVDERVQPVDAFRPDVAATPAVAAVGAAELDELLAAEGERAVPAVAGADIDLGLIEKFHLSPSGCSRFPTS